jgi:hypothetical protein
MITIFPIRNETKKLLDTLPNIRGLFSKEIKKRQGTYQVFRLLDNPEYPNLKELLQVIEKLLTNEKYKEYVRSVLKEKDRMTFGDKINEVCLLHFLDAKGFEVETFDTQKGTSKVPEFKAQKNNHTYLIEIWTFHELYPYKAFFDLIYEGIKYLDINLYYEGTISIKQKYDIGDMTRFSYPEEFRERFKDDQGVLNSFINKMLTEIKQGIENGKRKFSYKITKKTEVTLNLRKISNNGRKRPISPKFPGTNCSTVNYFRPPVEFTRNEFFLKLGKKLKKNQLGERKKGINRIFMANFSGTSEGDRIVKGTSGAYDKRNLYEALDKWCKQKCSDLVDVFIPVVADLDYYLGEITYASNKNVSDEFINDFR